MYHGAMTTSTDAAAWPPRYLPSELIVPATAADLIRQETDYSWDGGEGVCLGVTAFLSYILQDLEIDHKLANGIYLDDEGEHAHWWIETASGWILDGSRGQFSHSDGYRSGVVQKMDSAYKLQTSWAPGHSSMELVEAELKRCFGIPEQALEYLDLCEDLWREAQDLVVA